MAKKQASLGCLFWLALLLLVLVIFLFNQKNIEQVIKNTGFLEFASSFFQKNKDPVKVSITSLPQQTSPAPQRTQASKPSPAPKPDKPTPREEVVIELTPERTPDNPRSLSPKSTKRPTATPVKTPVTELPADAKIRRAKLYFVGVNTDGQIYLKPVIRPVTYIDSPLKEVIVTLLKGQNSEEINQGLLTMIPKNTNLRNIYIKGNVAYLDFSIEFSFNSLGREGLKAQLQQLIYTVTEFSNIKSVQFLIEGKIRQNLSSEGLYIGEPLTRLSLQ